MSLTMPTIAFTAHKVDHTRLRFQSNSALNPNCRETILDFPKIQKTCTTLKKHNVTLGL